MTLALSHWNAAAGAARAAELRRLGYRVEATTCDPAVLRRWKETPPEAVVIDLSRAPSKGRDAALAVRDAKATRGVPLVFVAGDPVKVAGIRALLPDAVYADWEAIATALRTALTHPPVAPRKPTSRFAGYAGAPLVKKLGIKANFRVWLRHAPADFEATLGELPEGAALGRRPGKTTAVTIWFVRTRRELAAKIAGQAARLGAGKLWIAWPKKEAAPAGDLTQRQVRESGLAAGLVDFKICAIDAAWSALCFVRRK